MNIDKDFQALLNVYAGSKVLRLGVAYLESEEHLRHVLAKETGFIEKILRLYSLRVVYWPHTKPVETLSLRTVWTDKEDNLIMELWQTAPKNTIYRKLKDRTKLAIQKRASFLGVTR